MHAVRQIGVLGRRLGMMQWTADAGRLEIYKQTQPHSNRAHLMRRSRYLKDSPESKHMLHFCNASDRNHQTALT